MLFNLHENIVKIAYSKSLNVHKIVRNSGINSLTVSRYSVIKKCFTDMKNKKKYYLLFIYCLFINLLLECDRYWV